jgi:hypothetical protein
MDVREMKAGNELDIEVIKKVMAVTWTIDNGEAFIWENGPSGYSTIFNPSMNLSDAWKVVERLAPDHWVQITQGKHSARCEIGKYMHSMSAVGYAAETVPLAICKAALLAMEGM